MRDFSSGVTASVNRATGSLPFLIRSSSSRDIMESELLDAGSAKLV
jgi:hypothetical protein